MQNDTLVSVIVPVYNARKFLSGCVESLLAQTHAKLDIVLVDDGSRDDSLTLCREYARKDARIRVISQKNAGPAAARNAALALARGEYFMFADSDDYLPPDACERLLNAMEGNDLALGHFYYQLDKTISERGLLAGSRTIGEREFLLSLLERPGTFYFSALWNKMYRADLIRDLDLQFDPSLVWGEDFAFNMQYYHAVRSVGLVEAPVYYYVKSMNSSSLFSWLNIPKSIRIKARLYRHYKALFVEKQLYKTHRATIHRYICNITLTD